MTVIGSYIWTHGPQLMMPFGDLLEEVHHGGQALRVYCLAPLPVCSLCFVPAEDGISQQPAQASCCHVLHCLLFGNCDLSRCDFWLPAAMPLAPLWTLPSGIKSPNSFYLSHFCQDILLQQKSSWHEILFYSSFPLPFHLGWGNIELFHWRTRNKSTTISEQENNHPAS